LGKFILDGIPPAPRGIPQIEVTFDVDANGILNVTAKDKATGRDQSMRIMPDSGLTEDEIQRMVGEADRHREEDARRKSDVETRNNAEALVHAAEKTMTEHGDKIDSGLKSDIEGQIKTLKDALQGSNIEAIHSASQNLSQALQKIGEQVYQQAGQRPAAEANEGTSRSGDSDEDVIEGQFEEA
jgi:molecular chaperone DnaK